MSVSLLHGLAREIAALLAPLRSAVESPLAFERLVDALGLVSGDNTELLESLRNAADLATRLEELASQQEATFETVGTVLDAAGAAFSLVRTPIGGAGTGADLEAVGRDLVELLVAERLAGRYPVAREVAVLLTLVEPAERQPTPPLELSNGDVVRIPEAIDRLHLERLVDLVREPVGTLRVAYVNDLQTDQDAQAVGGKLFPPLVRLLSHLGVSCRYGIPRDDQSLLGDTAPLISHALVVYVDDELNGATAEAGVLLAISPASRGDLGLVVTPFGAIATTRRAGSWTVDLQLTAGVGAIAYGRHGFTLLASPGTTDVTGSAVATLVTVGDDPAAVLGAPDGVRLEIGGARLAMEAALSEARPALALSADLSPATFVIAPADADGFLASFLPAEGLRTTFELGMTWSSEKGFTFRGHAGLDATIPVGLSVAGLTLSSVHLGLVAREGLLVAEVSANLGASIGPVSALVDRLGIEAVVTFPEDGGNVGVANLETDIKPPTGVGLTIDVKGVVTGGGFLRYEGDNGQYSGVVQLSLEGGIAVNGVGLIATHMPDGEGYSLLVIITAAGFEPIPLPLGFLLTRIGGLLAVNRTFAEDVLRAGLKNHLLDSVMFPQDPFRNAPQILSNLNKVFPPANGSYLVGPMAQLEWGTPTLLTAQIAVILEFGARLRLLVLAQITAILPEPKNDLIRLQLDAVGVVDFDQGTAAVDASLYDSRLLKKFVLTGDMALRLKWVAPPNFAMAVGGLHPAFNPPPNFPKLERIAINLAAGDNPRIRCEAYLALTGSSIQFGARAELYASAAGFSIQGEIGFDVLIQRDPFAFVAEFYAQVQLKRGSTNLFKVRVEGALAGPRPLHVRAKATFEILWWDVSVRVDRTLVSGERPPLPAPVDVLPLLLATLGLAGSWTARLPAGQQQGVTLRGRPELAGEILLHPLGRLTVSQTVVPLGMDISRFGDAAPAGARRFTIGRVTPEGQTESPEVVRDFFAPAQFFEMSDDEKLSRPSFESLPAGVSLGAGGVAISANPHDWLEVPAIEFETIIVGQEPDGGEPPPPPDLYQLTAELLGRQARFGAAANSRLRHTGQAKYRTTSVAKHRVAKEGWSIVATDDLTVQAAPGVDGTRPASYSEAEQALRQLRRERPDRAGDLTILRLSEVRGP